MAPVEAVRRYSKQPHLRRTSERLARLLDRDLGHETRDRPAAGPAPHVHKLAHRLTAETIQALQQAYQTGASLAELQQQFDLGRGSVQRLLREAGARRRRKSLTDAKMTLLVERYEAGLTIREIAAEQQLPKTTVQDALVRAGVTMRPATRRNADARPTYIGSPY
jgi:uncharacterized protein (DUF433 family)